jgi:hypothetical protein
VNIREGNGFLIQTALDSPWAGWFCASELDWAEQIKASPSLFLRHVGELASLFPGGVSVLWDLAGPLLGDHAASVVLEGVLLHLPGLSLHFRDSVLSDPVEAPLNAWLHSQGPPEGAVGARWRQGHIGWVPQGQEGWSLPGLGRVPDDMGGAPFGALWGVATVPAPAVGLLDAGALAIALEGEQARVERAMSHRVEAGAWPSAVQFQRRRTAWRLELTGGWEYSLSGRAWDDFATEATKLRDALAARLKCTVEMGVSADPWVAGALGEQAMALGLPWMGALELPPAPPAFTPGMSADPRKAGPLESRATFPAELAPLLSDPPLACLRVPAVPSGQGARSFIQRLETVPAVRWIPPDMPPPGPFRSDVPWDPSEAFPGVDAKAVQPSLFDLDE